MRSFHVLVFTISGLLVALTSDGKIINAYERGIGTARRSLKHLQSMSATLEVRRRLAAVRAYVQDYTNTERLLQEFKRISPLLYHWIDTIRDKRGRPVDVHIKVVRSVNLFPPGLLASTCVNTLHTDRDACSSNYGPHTVSVTVLKSMDSLLMLAHELGHVSYVVRHMAGYVEYFERHYGAGHDPRYWGHKFGDPSGKSAILFEKTFKEDWNRRP